MLARLEELRGTALRLTRSPAAADDLLRHAFRATLHLQLRPGTNVALFNAIGATIDHALWALIHECSHNLIFRRRTPNLWMAIVLNLPLVAPATFPPVSSRMSTGMALAGE